MKVKFLGILLIFIHKCIILDMMKTADSVQELFLASDTAQLAAQERILNVSAFAEQIQKEVEKRTFKTVSVGTIRTALYRLLESAPPLPLKPKVILDELTIHPKVVDLTYSLNSDLLRKISFVTTKLIKQGIFFTLSQSTKEVTIIVDESKYWTVEIELGTPDKIYRHLVAVSVTFDQAYLTVPNMMYSLFAGLAARQINVMEVVSTLTSLTFVVYERELDTTIKILRGYLGEKKE